MKPTALLSLPVPQLVAARRRAVLHALLPVLQLAAVEEPLEGRIGRFWRHSRPTVAQAVPVAVALSRARGAAFAQEG